MSHVTCKTCGGEIPLTKRDHNTLRAGMSIQVDCPHDLCRSREVDAAVSEIGRRYRRTYSPGDLKR